MSEDRWRAIIALAKRRGLVLPAAELDVAADAGWAFGPIGVELRRNVKDAWWLEMVHRREDVLGLDTPAIVPSAVMQAAGHLDAAQQPIWECVDCNRVLARSGNDAPDALSTCPDCGSRRYRDARNRGSMFKTFVGPSEEASATAWLRSETASGSFASFRTIQTVSRRKLPLGVAQTGKAFRNESTPGNFIFRMREFEQMELEFFVEPGTDEKWFEEWVDTRRRWHLDLGLREENVRLREHGPEQLAPSAKKAVDVEYRFPFGWSELEGVTNRADFDLTQHTRFSGQDLSYYDQERDDRYIPYVIETSLGADRSMLAFLADAYHEDEAPTAKGGTEKRTVLRLDGRLAPMKAAVLPLSRNERLVPVARELARDLRARWMIEYDDAGAIGRRYRRQDEIGTPYCITVDFDSLDDHAVTVRDRDTMTQDRVGTDRLVAYLDERLPK